MRRARDWLMQALRDISHARKSLELGDFEWSCFASQQAAEKALKAVYQVLGAEAWGHDLVRLLMGLRELGVEYSEELIEDAAFLDKQYILTRHPNGFTEGYPASHYTRRDAILCIESGERIVEWAKNILEKKERGSN